MISYCSVLSFAAKLTEIEDMLCLGTMRGCGYNILLNGNQAKIVQQASTCYLIPQSASIVLLGSLRHNKGGFETMVSDKIKSQKVSLSNILAVLFVVRHSFDCSLMQIVRLA